MNYPLKSSDLPPFKPLPQKSPSIDGHEITDKGYINQRSTLERRKRLVELLYKNRPPPDVVEIM
jgi:feruloyl-CoA synthase